MCSSDLEFDRSLAWADWGMRSMAHWLGWKCGIGPVAAREQMRVAHALVGLPATAVVFSGGRISYSKVRALSRVATAATEGFFLNVAEHGTAAHLERIARYARRGMALENPDRLQANVETQPATGTTTMTACWSCAHASCRMTVRGWSRL